MHVTLWGQGYRGLFSPRSTNGCLHTVRETSNTVCNEGEAESRGEERDHAIK